MATDFRLTTVFCEFTYSSLQVMSLIRVKVLEFEVRFLICLVMILFEFIRDVTSCREFT